MPRRLNTTIITALCTSFFLIAFAFDQRYGAWITVPAGGLFVAAAIICLLPVFYALFRRDTCREKS